MIGRGACVLVCGVGCVLGRMRRRAEKKAQAEDDAGHVRMPHDCLGSSLSLSSSLTLTCSPSHNFSPSYFRPGYFFLLAEMEAGCEG